MSAALAPRRPAFWRLVLPLTLLLGGVNVFKPLHIDDGAYFYFARQIAAHPFDPYGFWLLWYQEPNRALEILAPPVVPFTWALGLRLFGDHPALCKLLLLPYVFLLVQAVYSLARRFAAGLETPLTVMTILSPALWPSTNYMLDVPAMGLALTAIALFLRACDEESFFQAACAGLIAGLAFETKYTACVAIAAFVLAAILRRRWLLGIAAVLMATHLVLAWELLIATISGRSHFFLNFTGVGTLDGDRLLDALQGLVDTKGPLITSLLSLLGGITLPLLLLGMFALGWRRRWLFIITTLFVAGIVAIGLFDSHFGGRIAPSARFFGPQQTPPLNFELADVIFAVFGAILLLVAGIIAWSSFRSSSGAARREVVFLVGWLALEIAAYFPLTPFPAVRRVLGIFIVLTLLLGRYAAANYRPVLHRRTLYFIVTINVLLGLGMTALDFRGACVQRDAAIQAAEWIRDHGGGRVWFAGHWSFQYYAEHHGMQAVIPEHDRSGPLRPSRLETGDWLVLPDDNIEQQTFQLDPDYLREVTQLTFDDRIPLSTVRCYYGTAIAIQHLERPRLVLRIYQVQKDLLPVPRSKP